MIQYEPNYIYYDTASNYTSIVKPTNFVFIKTYISSGTLTWTQFDRVNTDYFSLFLLDS